MKTLLIISLLTVCGFIHAKNNFKLSQFRVVDLEKYSKKEVFNKIYLPFSFGSEKITNLEAIKTYDGGLVTRIELVYSSFHGLGEEEQLKLNKKRISTLNQLRSFAINPSLTELLAMRQGKKLDAGTSKTLFHGLVITFRPKPSEKSILSELKLLKESLEPKSLEGKEGETFDSDSIPIFLETITGEDIIYDTIYVSASELELHFLPDFRSNYSYANQDSTVTAVFKRNPQWKDLLVLCDVTGSMTP